MNYRLIIILALLYMGILYGLVYVSIHSRPFKIAGPYKAAGILNVTIRMLAVFLIFLPPVMLLLSHLDIFPYRPLPLHFLEIFNLTEVILSIILFGSVLSGPAGFQTPRIIIFSERSSFEKRLLKAFVFIVFLLVIGL